MDARIPIFGEISSLAEKSPWAFMRSSAQKNEGWKCRRPLPKAVAEEILPESVLEQAAQDGENLCFTDPVSNAIVADALLEQELVTDPQAAARLDAIRQLDDVAYDTAFEPPVSDYELDGLDLER